MPDYAQWVRDGATVAATFANDRDRTRRHPVRRAIRLGMDPSRPRPDLLRRTRTGGRESRERPGPESAHARGVTHVH
jgi:hypothetical protein